MQLTRDTIRYRTENKNLVTQELVGYQEAMPAWRDLEVAGQVPCHLHEIRARAKKVCFLLEKFLKALRNYKAQDRLRTSEKGR